MKILQNKMIQTTVLALGLMLFTACGGGTSVNTAPIADAGDDKVRALNTIVLLDGNSSTSTTGNVLSHSWTLLEKPTGSNAKLFNETTAQPDFTSDLVGIYKIGLVVHDGELDSVQDTVDVNVHKYKLLKKEFPNTVVDYSYDDNGNLLTIESDRDKDGSIERTTKFEYDAEGNQILKERDYRPRDGIADERTLHEYDTEGNEIKRSYDNEADGIIDSIWTYTYDEHGNELSLNYDYEPDDVVDQRIVYSYDEYGNRTSISRDNHNTGSFDSVVTIAYTYDNRDNILTQESSRLGGRLTVYTYDVHGNLLTDSSGESQNIYTYDEKGDKLTHQAMLRGEPNGRLETYEYDDIGNLISQDGYGTTTWRIFE